MEADQGARIPGRGPLYAASPRLPDSKNFHSQTSRIVLTSHHTADRESADYKHAYRQRTATERINSQAKALGIERPHSRNGQAIINRNTLIYTLINLRLLQRIRQRRPAAG